MANVTTLLETSNKTEANLETDFKHFEIQNYDIIFGILYGIIVVLGVVGNILVVTVVKKTTSMHTTTNFLLVNLALSDIITLLWNPRTYSFAFYPIHPRGVWGDYICKFFTGNAIISVAIGASVFTLCIVAVERYHALVKPLKATKLRIQPESVKYVIAVIWVLAFLINMPDFVVVYFDEHYGRCICPYSLEAATKLKVHVLCTVVFVGVLPFTIIGFSYLQIVRGIFFQGTIIGQSQGEEDHKSRKKLAKLLISVTIAFYSCYLPYGVVISLLALSQRETLVKKQDSYIILLKVVEFLVTCSSFLNPVLYAFQSSNYRQGFLKICCPNTSSNFSGSFSTHSQRFLIMFCVNKNEQTRNIRKKSERLSVLSGSQFLGRRSFGLNRVSVVSDITILDQNYQTLATSNVSFKIDENEKRLSTSNGIANNINTEKQCSRKSDAWLKD